MTDKTAESCSYLILPTHLYCKLLHKNIRLVI